MFAGPFLNAWLVYSHTTEARRTESNLPLAFAGSLCYVGVFMDLALLSALSSMYGWMQSWPAVVAELVDALP